LTLVAMPPSRPIEAAAPRTEVVIGRIAVVVESARPAAVGQPPPRPAARRPAASGEAASVAHFGLGQL
jgi:hypothetical protein